jgi:hypothetical protein
LQGDSCETVTLALATIRSKVLEAPQVPKTIKMRLLSASVLVNIAALMSKWKGPRGEQSQHVEDQEQVAAAAQDFLTVAFTSVRWGVVFADPSVGTSGQNHNHLLLSSLKSIHRPWESERASHLVADALAACPDQLRPFLQVLEKEWAPPRDTEGWLQVPPSMILP